MPHEKPWKITGFRAPEEGTNRGPRNERKSPSSNAPDSDNRRRFFYGLDLRVQAFAHRIGDAMIEVGQHVFQVVMDHPRHTLDRLQPAMRCPEIPALPIQLRPSPAAIVP